MGGRGTFSNGITPTSKYKTVGVYYEIPILEKINGSESINLPVESNTSSSYILLGHDGNFLRYREFNKNHEMIFDIDYHKEKIYNKASKILHIHEYKDNIRTTRLLTKQEFEKYKFLLGAHL